MDINQAQAQLAQIMEEAKKAAALQVAVNQAIPASPATSVPATQPTTPSTGPRQFDASEIQELTEIREAYEQATLTLGQIEMQKREVVKNEKKINEKMNAIEAQEKLFLEKIMLKYGEGTFDITTGVFTPKS